MFLINWHWRWRCKNAANDCLLGISIPARLAVINKRQ